MRKIITGPNPILNTVCEPFDWATDYPLLEELVAVMRNNPRAIGLAANQIGITKRFIAVRVQMKIGHPEIAVLVNPKVIKASSIMKTAQEECMSFPGTYVNISRPMSCRVSFELGPGQGTIEQKFLGLSSRCILHEIWHLNGITIENFRRKSVQELAY